MPSNIERIRKELDRDDLHHIEDQEMTVRYALEAALEALGFFADPAGTTLRSGESEQEAQRSVPAHYRDLGFDQYAESALSRVADILEGKEWWK